MDMMMSEVLMRLGWTSLQSAVLVALVWGVCRLLPQLPSATRCRLWWLVAAQAVLGLLWSSPLELAVLPAPAAVTATAMALFPRDHAGGTMANAPPTTKPPIRPPTWQALSMPGTAAPMTRLMMMVCTSGPRTLLWSCASLC